MFERKCPDCKKSMQYKSKGALTTGIKSNSSCHSCGFKKSKYGQDTIAGKYIGKKNNFWGKKHTKETKDLISKTKTGNSSISDERKKQISEHWKTHTPPMTGKTVYGIWLEKYGKEEADKRDKIRREKWSKASSGKNNPMYGKPSPNGAGNGWKGWFQNQFFRSLRELCFMIWLLESGLKWITGETISIPYIDVLGNERTYRPDFIVGNKIYEIKPLRLVNSPNNKLKIKALKKYCKNNSLIYEIKDINIDSNKIKKYLDSGDIKFNGDYLERFEKYVK